MALIWVVGILAGFGLMLLPLIVVIVIFSKVVVPYVFSYDKPNSCNPSIYVIYSGELYECLFCFTEQCLKFDVILETVNHYKNVRCRVCDHRPSRIRHG